MSAYSASVPVTASTTAPSEMNAASGAFAKKRSACAGLSARKNRGLLGDLDHAQHRDDDEVQDHHRSEEHADARRAVLLHAEQHDDDDERRRHDPMLEPGRR